MGVVEEGWDGEGREGGGEEKRWGKRRGDSPSREEGMIEMPSGKGRGRGGEEGREGSSKEETARQKSSGFVKVQQ